MRHEHQVITAQKTSVATKISIVVVIGAAVAALGLAVLGMIFSFVRS